MYEADHSRGHYWSILVTVVQSCTKSIDSWAQEFDMTTMVLMTVMKNFILCLEKALGYQMLAKINA